MNEIIKIEYLNINRLNDFIEYCNKHKLEIDESLLSSEDLKNFEPDENNPTYIALDDKNEIVAAISLSMDDYYRKGKRGRFRVFHSIYDSVDIYKSMFKFILNHIQGLEYLNVFVPLNNLSLRKNIENLYFIVERYSFYLERDDREINDYSFPLNYYIKPFEEGKDEATWCMIRNTCFKNLKGSETPVTVEMVKEMITDEDYIDGGMMILYHQEEPIGIIRGSLDDDNGEAIMHIGPLAILPEYQGKGLGRNLLRALIDFGKKNSLNKTSISVNGENERAKSLYIQEGFKEVIEFVCYRYIV